MIKEEYKLELKYRWKLFLELYLKRWIVINAVLLFAACSNYISDGEIIGFILLCATIPVLLLLFMFADYHNPDNNPVHNSMEKYKKSDDYTKTMKPIIKRRNRKERIKKILK